MPGMSGSTNTKNTVPSMVANTAMGRITAAVQARKGEGDEIIVGEFEEGRGIGDNNKASGGIFDRMQSSDQRASMFDGDAVDSGVSNANDNSADYTYDSDSSADGEPKRLAQRINASKTHGKYRGERAQLPPQRLPVPPTRQPGSNKIDFMYETQLGKDEDGDGSSTVEEKGNETEIILEDPPLDPPFLNLMNATLEQQAEEQKSWMIFKLPTRLPRLAPPSTLSGIAIKRDEAMDTDDDNYNDDDLVTSHEHVDPTSGVAALPEHVTSSSTSASLNNGNNNYKSPSAYGNSSNTNTGGGRSSNTTRESTGYDDTLKDAGAGRYGKIIMYKSGKAYLEIGGRDSNNPPVRLRLTNGLSCGFLQQAVSIDNKINGYVPLGEVKKSFIVTPDVETAFTSSS
jgi:hypothetical protein